MGPEGYIDYGEPQSHGDIAANHPLTASEYRKARETDDYRTMASMERDVRNEQQRAAVHGEYIEYSAAAISLILITFISWLVVF